MEVQLALQQLQHDVVALVAVGEEEQSVGLPGAEPQLEAVLARLGVLSRSGDRVRDTAVTVKRRPRRV